MLRDNNGGLVTVLGSLKNTVSPVLVIIGPEMVKTVKSVSRRNEIFGEFVEFGVSFCSILECFGEGARSRNRLIDTYVL